MMQRRTVVLSGLALGLSACGAKHNKFLSYDGPEVTRLFLLKGQRQLYLMHGDAALRQYPVGLGFAPWGDKHFEGDGRTPEGRYTIDKRNPNSSYHLSIGISYPRPEDIVRARKAGRDPGGEIFIHGEDGKKPSGKRDWTAGCIAVTDPEMEEIYAMVENGTPILITP